MCDVMEDLVVLMGSKWMGVKSDCMLSGILMVPMFAFRGFLLSGPAVVGYFVVGLQLCLLPSLLHCWFLQVHVVMHAD